MIVIPSLSFSVSQMNWCLIAANWSSNYQTFSKCKQKQTDSVKKKWSIKQKIKWVLCKNEWIMAYLKNDIDCAMEQSE